MKRNIIILMTLFMPFMISEVNADNKAVLRSDNIRVSELPEVLVESRKHRVLHMLAYVREYSTMSTYSDTVFLYREKMVDYMLPVDRKVRFKGWSRPRIIKSRSYYRFTDSGGLDSVSDECNQHFSWSDWVGVAPAAALPSRLQQVENGTDTVKGKYSPIEVWRKQDDIVSLEIDALAGDSGRRWIPDLAGFFKDDMEFGYFRLRYDYENVVVDDILPRDLTRYSFDIDSKGRGHDMFRFNRRDESFYVTTHAEVYFIDKEYITVKEARKWADHDFDSDSLEIFEPAGLPQPDPFVMALVGRVDGIDKKGIRLALEPDFTLAGSRIGGRNFSIGRRALLLLKQMTGITAVKTRRNLKNRWSEFRNETRKRNQSRDDR